MLLSRISVAMHVGIPDTLGEKTGKKIKEWLGFDIESVRLVKVFTIQGFDPQQAEKLIDLDAFHDPVIQKASLHQILDFEADWVIEVGFRPGVTDNEGKTAKMVAELVLNLDKSTRKNSHAVYTSTQYHIKTRQELRDENIREIAEKILCNELIQRYEFRNFEELKSGTHPFLARAAQVLGTANIEISPIEIPDNDAEMIKLSKSRTLALNTDEMRAIRDFYRRDDTIDERGRLGLPDAPLDAELELIAQTWSEHCKHKIFASEIEYEDVETGEQSIIDNLYKTYIQKTTESIRKTKGSNDYCKSVFTDNAGVITFDDDWNVCIKVETHNSPSALDPYGGALTGIVGVNRDPLGTGLGAKLVCNTDVFCFANPFYDKPIPKGLLHPRRVFDGVREGVEHGGNKSGIPTVNGSIVFDDRYLGKPLVYCGTVGIMPDSVTGIGGVGMPRKGYTKKANVDDAIVMIGGRIGADGIHGATFSSEKLDETSPVTAVQIGDPITQRKILDFILIARDRGLYSSITDNGAGGLASSVGEMAEDTNGCEMDLSYAPLKYDGLKPWEILISEAQERMTLAVPQSVLDEFLKLADHLDVEASVLGKFTDSGYMHVTYGDKIAVHLPMDFLHKGLPRYHLKAKWLRPTLTGSNECFEFDFPSKNFSEFLCRLLKRLNVCCKEYVVRQYDHEVQGGSVIKPLMGLFGDAPSDAGALRPVLELDRGIILSHGICPKFSEFDTYDMATCAVDEAIRNAVSIGADPDYLAGCDNFCWCDPVKSEHTPDGEYKLAQLVRACRGLAESCTAFGVPCVSGKDSMKNDFSYGNEKISIPPTLLFSVIGVIEDVKKTVSCEFKNSGDSIFIIGVTKDEMGGSEAYSELGIKGRNAPKVNATLALRLYRGIFRAIKQGVVNACHDVSDGGIATAIAEMCIGGRIGAVIDEKLIPAENGLDKFKLMFSESASRLIASVPNGREDNFLKCFNDDAKLKNCISKIGFVSKEKTLKIGKLISINVDDLTNAYKSTLNW